MNQLVAIRNEVDLQLIATLEAILAELRKANQREAERDERQEVERAAALRKYAGL